MATIFINGKKIEFDEKDQTILDIAQSSDVYIPTLCDHPELEPHGGCRMCLVQVEGWRSLATACTTTAKDDMVIETENDEITKLRKTILQLLLKEHPSACMVCDEWEECTEYRRPYKAGSITGCQTCPNRDFCQLREVASYLNIKELTFQPKYKEVPIERNDPFFDRDYNLCILCARCYRVCEDVRGTGAISFSQRGHETRVDTAFGKSHIESGCWFCGACVDVCPTGALSPRLTKWTGDVDSQIETTCVLCGIGCQVELDVKWGRVMGSRPGKVENAPNHHHMCVLGRFCIPSITNAPDRLKEPKVKDGDAVIPATWEEAIEKVVQVIGETDGNKIGFLGGPHLSVESAYLFQKIARVGAKSSNLDFQSSQFSALVFKELARDQDFQRIGSLDKLADVDWIITIGGDFVKTHQVVAKSCYMGVKKGAQLIVIGEVGLNLQRWASEYIPTKGSRIAKFVASLADHKTSLPGVDKEQAQRLVEITSKGSGAIIVGSGILESKEPAAVLRALLRLAGENGLIYPTFDAGNEAGLIRAGVQADMLPGPASITFVDTKTHIEKKWGVTITEGFDFHQLRKKASKGQIDVLYITDGSIPTDGFEKVPFVIYQSPYPSDWLQHASVILPSAAFSEEDGTFINMEMKELKLVQASKPPGIARQDWTIFTELGNKLGADGFDFKSIDEISNEVHQFTRNIEVGGQAMRKSWKPGIGVPKEWSPQYRGAVLHDRIGDLDTFIRALPDREQPTIEEDFDKMVKRVAKEEGVLERRVVK